MYERNFSITDDLEHDFLEIDNRKIHVAKLGSGRPLLLIHGWPEFWMTWLPLSKYLKNNYQLIMPDLYGFGQSDKPNKIMDNLDANFHSEYLIKIMDNYGLKDFVIITHDIGSWIAQNLMKEHPNRVNGGIFFNCPTSSVSLDWIKDGHFNEIWYMSFQQLELSKKLVGYNKETCKLYFEFILNHWSYQKNSFDNIIDEWVDNFMKPNSLEGGFSWYKSMNKHRIESINSAIYNENNFNNTIDIIDTPCFAYWGKFDPVLKSEWTKFLPNHFSDIKVELAEDAGHFVQVEIPEKCNNKVRMFLNKINY